MMYTNKVSEACCLLFTVITFRTLMLVNCRPQNGSQGVASNGSQSLTSRRLDGGRMLSCEEVSKRQLWIRLDRVQYQERIPGAANLVPNTSSPVVPIVDRRTLKHPETATHSRRALRHRSHSKTGSGLHRRRRRRRRQAAAKNRIRKRATRARRKFLKRLARTKDAKKVERILKRSDARWRCTFQERWMTLGDDYFPEYVRTGSCIQDSCMFGFYQCKQATYQLPVLRKDRLNCNVIPALHADTVYEEAWVEEHIEVVVGCECRPFGLS